MNCQEKFNYKNPIELFKLLIIFVAPCLLVAFDQSTFVFILFLVSLLMIFKFPIDLKYKLIFFAADLLIIVPYALSSNGYFLDVATQVCIYAILAIGLNIVVGFAGLLDLGYVGFYAVGAYCYAIFATGQANEFIPEALYKFPVSGMWFWAFLAISMIVAGIFGILLGLPVLRLKGDYLAIVTLGFGEIIRIILNNLDKPINLTNGPKGLSPVMPPELFGYKLSSPIHYYFITLIILFLVIIVANRLDKSRIGRAWCAIKEDEIAARCMGINIVKMKLFSFAVGASFAGMMGVVFSVKQTFIDPSSFGFMESIGILAMVILGGIGNISGSILGAGIVIVLQLLLLKDFSHFLRELSVSGVINIPSQLDPAKYEKLVFGVILVLMCIFRPKGILPVKRNIDYIKNKIVDNNDEKKVV